RVLGQTDMAVFDNDKEVELDSEQMVA
ncbi:MAG: hypothetical protein JWP34_3321, partial [Massilia sp.]|nr:hypothetical protein [Massilia sp.]